MAIELTITEYPVGARPDVTIPDEEIYKILGDEGIRKMVNDHYELLRKSPIRKMFPQDNEGFEQAKLNSSRFHDPDLRRSGLFQPTSRGSETCGKTSIFHQSERSQYLVRMLQSTLVGYKTSGAFDPVILELHRYFFVLDGQYVRKS